MVNEETGKPEKVNFDWVPPNTEKNLAARYMALLPPEKRPVAGSEVRSLSSNTHSHHLSKLFLLFFFFANF